jgi:hypothetical protein
MSISETSSYIDAAQQIVAREPRESASHQALLVPDRRYRAAA